jgi:hypothetical protein
VNIYILREATVYDYHESHTRSYAFSSLENLIGGLRNILESYNKNSVDKVLIHSTRFRTNESFINIEDPIVSVKFHRSFGTEYEEEINFYVECRELDKP